ncbi:MAG TPA: CRISPR-associated helicase Cas3' [Nitrososphaeraceae archaeon]|jgi:CRISPR-associated endonuclease/helicase Cas3
MSIIRIYAKSVDDETGYKEPLAEHTIHDIEVGRRLVANLPFEAAKKRRIARDLDLCIAFHDVGKAATGFQASLEKSAPHWGHRHEILSAAAASAAGLKDSIVFAVITHHKTLPPNVVTVLGCLPDEEIPYLNHMSNGCWQDMAKEWYANIEPLSEEFRMICEYLGREDLLDKKLSLSQLSDNMFHWLQRAEQTKIPYEQREYNSLLRGLMMSADHIASANNFMPMPILSLKNTFPNLSPPKPHGFQIAASKHKGNLILRAPTGSGKTAAALLWAQLNQQHNGRLFYALPTTASINAMYLRLKDSFGDIDSRLVGLLHSRTVSSLYSMFEGDDTRSKQRRARTIGSLVREMYFSIRVCTPHQILRYTLQGKGWEAMLSEFPHSVFIFDEIHAYNPKLTGLMMATAKYLIQHKGRVMFLTATLPTFIRKYIEHELKLTLEDFIEPSCANSSDKKILEQLRHTIEVIDGNILASANVDLIAKQAAKVSATMVVCNHVDTAIQVYIELDKRVKGTVLLHSRFNRRDRNQIEKDLQKSLPKVLVATQVIEVSLDLDFQQGFTEPAAIDALVQRMGRINRQARQTQPAKVHIFKEQCSADNEIYDEKLRNDSLAALTKLKMPLSEESLNAAADHVYGNGYSGKHMKDYKDGLNYDQIKYFRKCLVAGTSENWIDIAIEQNEGTVELLPMPLAKEYHDLKEQHSTLAADDLLVPVRRRLIPRLIKNGRLDAEQDPWLLKYCRYSNKVGLEIYEEHSN